MLFRSCLVCDCGRNSTTCQNLFNADSYYRCKVSCSGFNSFSTPVHVHKNHPTLCYCTSGESTSLWRGLDIGNVNFLGISNGLWLGANYNPTAINSYSDFTYLSPQDLLTGNSFPIVVTLIDSGFFYNNTSVSVFIDFDRNGI